MPHPHQTAIRPSGPPVSLVPGLLAFFVLGLLPAAYGPLFPALQSHYGVSSAAAAWIASTHFLGSTPAPILTGLALTRLSTRRVVNMGALTLMLGVLIMAFAPAWTAALGGALTAGLGFGVISAALNTAYSQIGTRPSNVVNAMFGVGSLSAPLMIAATATLPLSMPFLIVAGMAALTLLAVWHFNVPEVAPPPSKVGPEAGEAAGAARPFAWPVVLAFALLLVAYVCAEVGFGNWIGKHLGSLGWQNTALIVSGYWGGLTLGRVLTGLFGPRFQPGHVVLSAALLATTCALSATLFPPAAPVAYLLAGVALGPIFPTTLVWLSGVLPPHLVPFLLIAGNVGGVISPALVGWLTGQAGPGVIPLSMLLFTLFMSGMVLLAFRLAPQKRL